VPGGTRAESGGRQGSGQSGARCFFALDHLFLAMDKLRRPRILTLKLGGIERLVFVEKTIRYYCGLVMLSMHTRSRTPKHFHFVHSKQAS
jgi:hypothetical protein